MTKGSDDDTVAQTNNDSRSISFPEVSYLKINVQVNKATKVTMLMKSKFRELIKCIRDADNTATI